MKCDSIQTDILSLADPRQLTGPLFEHVDACPTCQAWWKGVQRIETLVQHLPAPAAPGNKKQQLLAELHGVGPVIHNRPQVRSNAPGLLTRNRVYALAGLAASVALVLGMVALLRNPNRQPIPQSDTAQATHPFLERVIQQNIALAKSATPADKLANLGLYAEDVHQEARDLARVASVDDLKVLAGWYDTLVREGLVKQAEALPPLAIDPATRAALLRDLASKLGSAGDEAEKLSTDVPPAAQDSMRRMAETARTGQQKLRQLAGGA